MDLPAEPSTPRISRFEVSLAFSKALDMVDPSIVDHQKRVALIAAFLAEEVNRDGIVLKPNERNDLVIAGLLHDIGAVTVVERLEIAKFDSKENRHAEIGANFLGNLRMLEPIAKNIRFHHQPWRDGDGAVVGGQTVPLASFILCLADRIEVLVDKNTLILDQVRAIKERVLAGIGRKFHPILGDAFMRLAEREAFWLDIVDPDLDTRIKRKISARKRKLTMNELLDLAHMFAVIIDLRSNFTATHSFGVAASAAAIGRAVGLTEQHRQMIEVAGYLHDIGKITIPRAILEKPGKLDQEEYNKMRTHTYHTFAILSAIPGMQSISEWAAYHHEQINGDGYPFHLSGGQLSIEARILSIADKFAALAEDRPYRQALPEPEVVAIMQAFADSGEVDKKITAVLIECFDEINEARLRAQGKETQMIADFHLEAVPVPRREPERSPVFV